MKAGWTDWKRAAPKKKADTHSTASMALLENWLSRCTVDRLRKTGTSNKSKKLPTASTNQKTTGLKKNEASPIPAVKLSESANKGSILNP